MVRSASAGSCRFCGIDSDVSKLLQFASREKIPVTARGAGFGYVGGCVPIHGGIALSLMRMNRIKEINFADAVAIVEPGVITGELKAADARKNYSIRRSGEHERLHVLVETSLRMPAGRAV